MRSSIAWLRSCDARTNAPGRWRTADLTAENAPPVLQVTRLSPDELLIDYVSKRRMGALAVGIVRGVAHYYDEADLIQVEPTTSENGERVRIRVRRLRPA